MNCALVVVLSLFLLQISCTILLKNKNANLHRYTEKYLRSGQELNGNAPLQSIVKFKELSPQIKKRFEKETGIPLLQYIPNKAYVILGSAEKKLKALKLPYVDYISSYDSDVKICSKLLAKVQSNKKDHVGLVNPDSKQKNTAVKNDFVVISIFLIPNIKKAVNFEIGILKEKFQQFLDEDSQIHIISSSKLAAKVPISKAAHLTLTIANHPFVHWIDELPLKYIEDNKFSRGIVQSNVPFKPVVTQHGLTGNNQTIGYGDSGLDVYNCFFYDPDNPVPFASDNNRNAQHRKIAGYNDFMDKVDDIGGHGTHVGGTLAGKSLYETESLSEYDGMSPNAKLAFLDIGCSTEGGCRCDDDPTCPCKFMAGGVCPNEHRSLFMPTDLKEGYFPYSYNLGARIHSNSIGGSIDLGYTATSREIDGFVHEHKDFLIVWSAGNSGRELGFMTLSGPLKQAKNSLIIGASSAPYQSWLEYTNNFVNYESRAASFKAAFDKAYFCDCETTCAKSQCEFFSKLISEPVCCDMLQNCTLRFERSTNPVYDALKSCCGDCAKRNVEDAPEYFQFQNLADFSSIGPTMDGRIKPDVVTPGFFIFSAKSHASDPASKCESPSVEEDTGFNVKSMAGTSMSTPTAAGTAALVREYLVEGYYPTGERIPTNEIHPSAALMKAMLITSARPMNGYARHGRKFSEFSPLQRRYLDGFGLVNLDNVLFFKGQENEKQINIEDNVQIEQNSVRTFQYYNKEFSEATLSVTLVWTDPPASPSASVSLVNDLNLEVEYETGTGRNETYIGNALDSSMTVADSLNNVEKVLKNINTGVITVRVKGYNIPEGPQEFALVTTITRI